LALGTYDTLEVRANDVANPPANGAGGIGLSGFANTLVVADNRIVDSPADGITLSMAANTGGVTGNIVRGSGAGASGFANLQVTNVALAPGFVIRNNDLASPAAMSSAIISTPSLVAECNWFGSGALATVSALIAGDVDFSPFLTLGTDTASAPGFQPMAGSCSGQ